METRPAGRFPFDGSVVASVPSPAMPYPSSEAARRALRREWPWVSLGGAALACNAGFVNACVLSTFHVPVSHMTGAVSRLSGDVGTGNAADLWTVVALLAGFVAGAAVSGAVVGAQALRPGRRYGVVLIAEGVALALAAVLLGSSMTAGVTLAAFACGLQNAMASSYYGLILRTTHLTGIVTDLGVLLGQRLRGQRTPAWKSAVLGALVAGFFAGGLAGAVAIGHFGPAALAAPAVACVLSGALYVVYLNHRGPAGLARADGPISRAQRRTGSRLPGPSRWRS